VEVADDVQRIAAQARKLGLGVGIAFNPETEVERAAAAADGMDLALCMSIHPGLSGQTFMPDALGRIEKLRSLLPETVFVQVDGGVSAENAGVLRDAGADLLVAGSAIFWQSDPAAAYLALTGRVEALAGAPPGGRVRRTT
jgi:ribulose-phosphate 3-epimerase